MNEKLEAAMRAAMTMSDVIAKHPAQTFHIIAALAHMHSELMDRAPWYPDAPVTTAIYCSGAEALTKQRLVDAYELFAEAIGGAVDSEHPAVVQTLTLQPE